MNKLPEVEEAKSLMLEATSWSVMRWLKEKKRVRKTADKANDTLWALQKTVRASWPDDLQSAYAELETGQQKSAKSSPAATQLNHFVRAVKQADDEAYQAHLDAEETFDRADKRLSTSLAREGCRKAIHSWELYEEAIEKAESITSGKAAKNS
jgi:hypothetical protein